MKSETTPLKIKIFFKICHISKVLAIRGTILSHIIYGGTRKPGTFTKIYRGAKMGKKRMTFWMDDRQIEGLKALSSITRIRQADFFREALDDLLAKYKKELKKAPKRNNDLA